MLCSAEAASPPIPLHAARNLPQELYKSLTWDRGKELTDHKRFTVATDIKVYFCDPHRPWRRGSNENTNGLLRQYFPKGTDLADHSQATLNEVARQLAVSFRRSWNAEINCGFNRSTQRSTKSGRFSQRSSRHASSSDSPSTAAVLPPGSEWSELRKC